MNKKEWLRSLRFLLFSISAGVIQLGSDTLLNLIPGVPEWTAYLIGLVLSVIWNFTFNRKYTFKAADNVKRAMLLVAGYYCVFAPATAGLEYYLTDLCGWDGFLVTLMNMVLNFVTEFLFQRFVVYRNSVDTNELAKK